jgi:hypothetical protein
MPSIAKPLPPLELLQELFYISETSPSGLRWRNPRANCLKFGDIAGTKHNKGYWQVTVTTDTKNRYYAHRVVLFIQTGKDPGNSQVDHIFGKDTPLSLRLATGSENKANSKKIKTKNGKECSSTFKGVSWDKTRRKWESKIQIKKKKSRLGYFTNEKEAAAAYNKAAIELFGEFAKLNVFE